MSISLQDITKEAESIKKQNLSPVMRVLLGTPTPSPQTLQKDITEIINAAHPSLIIIDSNETSAIPKQYSFESYTALLNEACNLCHSHGISCTNGGLEDSALIDFYLTTLDDDPVEYQRILNSLTPQQRKHVIRKTAPSSAARVREYLKHYRELPLDYINIVWRNFPEWLFGNIAKFIKGKFNKDTVTSEILIPANQEHRDEYLRYVRNMRLDYVIWHFPFENIKISDLVDQDDNLTEIAQSLRSANRSMF